MQLYHENSQIQLFDAGRWPKKPYCSDDKTARSIRSLRSALTRPYIQANPPYLRVWSIFDVDRAGGALAWDDAGLPPPSWAAANRDTGHAHLVWGLTAPVLLDTAGGRERPMRYLCAVESAFRARLQADPGYAGLITKNPSHPHWRTLVGPQLSYGIGELADWVDLPKHLPRRKPEEIGVGRNVSLFHWLRPVSYRQIREYKMEVRNFVLWHQHLYGKALSRNGEFRVPLDHREVWHIAKSVARWTWHRFDIAASDAKWSARQAHRGRKGGAASGLSRAAANEDKRATARLMRAQGATQAAIAGALGVTRQAVSLWLRAAQAKP
jgi:hypothetical protein